MTKLGRVNQIDLNSNVSLHFQMRYDLSKTTSYLTTVHLFSNLTDLINILKFSYPNSGFLYIVADDGRR